MGATLVRLLRATGHDAAGEFYINDAGRQVDLLGQSVAARFAEAAGVERAFPADGYEGEYVREIAASLPPDAAREALAAPGGAAWFRDQALEQMVLEQRRDLDEYGAEFARWFRESELHRSGAVAETLRELETRGMTYRARLPEVDRTADGAPAEGPAADSAELEEATYLRTGRFGDDKGAKEELARMRSKADPRAPDTDPALARCAP